MKAKQRPSKLLGKASKASVRKTDPRKPTSLASIELDSTVMPKSNGSLLAGSLRSVSVENGFCRAVDFRSWMVDAESKLRDLIPEGEKDNYEIVCQCRTDIHLALHRTRKPLFGDGAGTERENAETLKLRARQIVATAKAVERLAHLYPDGSMPAETYIKERDRSPNPSHFQKLFAETIKRPMTIQLDDGQLDLKPSTTLPAELVSDRRYLVKGVRVVQPELVAGRFTFTATGFDGSAEEFVALPHEMEIINKDWALALSVWFAVQNEGVDLCVRRVIRAGREFLRVVEIYGLPDIYAEIGRWTEAEAEKARKGHPIQHQIGIDSASGP